MAINNTENKVYFEKVNNLEIDQHFPDTQTTRARLNTTIDLGDIVFFGKGEIPGNFKELAKENSDDGMNFRFFISDTFEENKENIKKQISERIREALKNELLNGKDFNLPEDSGMPDVDCSENSYRSGLSINKDSLSANANINLDLELFHNKNVYPWEAISFNLDQIAGNCSARILNQLDDLSKFRKPTDFD